MKKYEDFLDKLQISMTAEQEEGYISTLAYRILHYNRFFLYIIMGIQLYNIGYAFLYTKGRFHTVPSRVYTILYLILLLASLGALFATSCLKKQIPINAPKVIHFQVLYGIILLLWSACITIYDQRVAENISVYLIVSLTVAMILYFTPTQAVLIYGILQFALFLIIPVFKTSAKDNYGVNLNLTITTLMAVLICLYHYYSDRKHYLDQLTIKEKASQLEYLANQDALTGLWNRRFLEGEVDSLYQQCLNEKIPVTFMMIDIDDFKIYNDNFGHLQGDECLRRVSWRIRKELDKEHEYLIRYGGEEFLYIGIGIDEAAAKQKGFYFNEIVRELIIGPSNREAMGITISIGSYTTIWDKATISQAWIDCVKKADNALYLAKNSGKDKCVCLSR